MSNLEYGERIIIIYIISCIRSAIHLIWDLHLQHANADQLKLMLVMQKEKTKPQNQIVWDTEIKRNQ